MPQILAAVTLLIAIGSATAIAQSSQPARAPAGDPVAGREAYVRTACYQCHGHEGQGGAAGPRVGPAPMMAFPAWVKYTRSPRGEMPPYSTKVLSDREMADIYAFLAALPGPKAVKDIPLLNPVK